MFHKNSRNQIEETQKGRERGVRRVSLSPGNAKEPFKRREAWRIMYSVAIMNGRRFGYAFIPSSSSSSSSSFSSSSYRGKTSLLLPRYSFFRVLACMYARITSGVSLASGRENDVTALSGRPKRRDAAAYTGTISRTAVLQPRRSTLSSWFTRSSQISI